MSLTTSAMPRSPDQLTVCDAKPVRARLVEAEDPADGDQRRHEREQEDGRREARPPPLRPAADELADRDHQARAREDSVLRPVACRWFRRRSWSSARPGTRRLPLPAAWRTPSSGRASAAPPERPGPARLQHPRLRSIASPVPAVDRHRVVGRRRLVSRRPLEHAHAVSPPVGSGRENAAGGAAVTPATSRRTSNSDEYSSARNASSAGRTSSSNTCATTPTCAVVVERHVDVLRARRGSPRRARRPGSAPRGRAAPPPGASSENDDGKTGRGRSSG